MEKIKNMKNVISKVSNNLFMLACLLMSLGLVTSCGDDEDGGGTTPVTPSTVVASFDSQEDADNSFTYAFTNNSVVNGITDNSFTSAWDFGGDGTSADESPSFTFSAEGTYEVTLTVTASDGEVGTTTETVMVTAPINRYASITDSTDDTNGDDTGELRYSPMDSIRSGRITFMYRVVEGPSMDIQDGFVNVSGTSTSGDDAIVEVRLKDNAPHEFREGASDDVIGASNFPEGMPNVWVPIEITWAANGTDTPTFSLVIDGQTIVTDAVSTTNGGDGDVDGHIAATQNGAFTFQFKYNKNDTANDGTFHIDDIVIYSSDSGTETVVFEDNFQGRTAGDNLDPDVDPDSPYHPNSMDATVGEEL